VRYHHSTFGWLETSESTYSFFNDFRNEQWLTFNRTTGWKPL